MNKWPLHKWKNAQYYVIKKVQKQKQKHKQDITTNVLVGQALRRLTIPSLKGKGSNWNSHALQAGM